MDEGSFLPSINITTEISIDQANDALIEALPQRQSLIVRGLNHVSSSISKSTMRIVAMFAWPHGALDRVECILKAASFTLLCESLLFWQTRFQRYTVNNITDDGEHLYLECFIEAAKSKIKMSTVLLTLAFTAMQIFFNGRWILLDVVLYMAIMTLFMSIALHTLAILCYEAIQQNPGGVNRLLSRARAMKDRPLALDPWIALSIPPAWTFWSFFLFFMAMVMIAWDQSLLTPPSLSSRATSSEKRTEFIAMAFVVLTLGLTCAMVVAMTWRRYIGHPRQNFER